MGYKKIPETLLFFISFVIISLGGYQCATRVIDADISFSDKSPTPASPRQVLDDNPYMYDDEYLQRMTDCRQSQEIPARNGEINMLI